MPAHGQGSDEFQAVLCDRMIQQNTSTVQADALREGLAGCVFAVTQYGVSVMRKLESNLVFAPGM